MHGCIEYIEHASDQPKVLIQLFLSSKVTINVFVSKRVKIFKNQNMCRSNKDMIYQDRIKNIDMHSKFRMKFLNHSFKKLRHNP